MSYYLCRNPRCDGTNWMCGRCRQQYPNAARAIDERKQEERDRQRRNRGSTMYGRNFQSNQEPTSAKGWVNPRTGEGHSSQQYSDNTRVSWDTDGHGESNIHWTNQNVPKGRRNKDRRHTPPPHAK